MKLKKIMVFLFCGGSLFAEAVAEEDFGKLRAGKAGMDIHIGFNQASFGGIIHLHPMLAISPYVLYFNQEVKNTSGTVNTIYLDSSTNQAFGGGAFLSFYFVRVENLHVKIMPGFSYMKGTLTSTGAGVNPENKTTRLNFQLFLGLQYALSNHLHLIGETGLNYSQYKVADTGINSYSTQNWNLYSGNLGLIFYFN